MVGDFAADRVHRQHVVVAHREVAAEIVLRDAGLEVVRRIDVEPPLEDVRRGVGSVDVGDQRLRQELRGIGGSRARGLLRGEARAAQCDQNEHSMHDRQTSGG